MVSRKPKTRMAKVSAYNPATYAVKVLYQPEEVESAWMPLGTIGVGNDFGVVVGPSTGDQVEVEFTDGDYGAPKATARFFSTEAPPPPVPSGEIWVVHKSGSLLKFHNDGTVELVAASTATYTATEHHFIGPVQMDNTLNVTEKVTSQADIQDNTQTNPHTMSQMRGIFNTHTHPVDNVQAGSGSVTTNTPNQTE